MVRGQKVILDRDLASLYGVPTKSLNRAVKRNLDRFPSDFMIQLTAEEAASSSHIRFSTAQMRRVSAMPRCMLRASVVATGNCHAANVFRLTSTSAGF